MSACDSAKRFETSRPISALYCSRWKRSSSTKAEGNYSGSVIKQAARIKSELALIRERTVKAQGYDTFQERIVLERAAETRHEFLSPELEAKRKRLLDVAVQMMVSQQVVAKQDENGIRAMRDRFEQVFGKGELHGFAQALELWYERR